MSSFYPLTHPSVLGEAVATSKNIVVRRLTCHKGTSLLDSRRSEIAVNGVPVLRRVAALKGLVYIQSCHPMTEVVRKLRKWRVVT